MNYKPKKNTPRKKYINNNVYEMAKKRTKEVIKITDEQIVSFSGGKDSLAVLNILEECYRELGITKKIKVTFYDEEVVAPEIIDFVKKIYDSEKYDFRWYCVPLESQKYVLGNTVKYIQWDKNREWVREKPEWSISLDVEGKSEYNMDEITTKDLEGRIAIFLGIRAEESLHRLNTFLSKPHKPYIHKSKNKNIILCKPIYDWEIDDIFTYFCKKDIEYCINYDLQYWNKQELRVATPLVAEGRKSFDKIKTTYNPQFYENIVRVFPEMVLQDRYFKEYDTQSIQMSFLDNYSPDEKGLFKFIDDKLEDETKKQQCISEITKCLKRREKTIKKDELDIFGGYPFRRLFMAVNNGLYKRNIMPYGIDKITKKDFIFEGYTAEEYMEYKNKLKRRYARRRYNKLKEGV